MLISFKDGIIESKNASVYKEADIEIYWQGLFYIPGLHSGLESIKSLCSSIRSNSIDYRDYYGSFIIVVKYSHDRYDVFTDNSHMRCLFIGEKAISSDFLSLVKYEESDSLSIEGITEMLSVVRSVSSKTIVEGICISDSYNLYHVEFGKCFSKSKNIGDLNTPSRITNPDVFFENLSKTLDDKRCICALTGGFDSRLVVAELKRFMSFDTFISDIDECGIEYKNSQRVALAGNLPWKPYLYNDMSIDSNKLLELFYQVDGRFDNASIAGKRIQFFNRQIETEGYDVLLTGEAGDMHKELWFMQDFPFYNKRATNVEMFYKKRIEIIPYHKFLSPELDNKYEEVKKQALDIMHSMVQEINTKSYDKYGYDLIWNKSSLHTQFYNTLTVYSPLQELELVRYSFSLPRKVRFFNYNMRRITTHSDRKMARVPTNYGTTSSSEFVYLVRDAFVQLYVYMRKLIKLQKKQNGVGISKKNEFDVNLRKNGFAIEALEYCKNSGYLNDQVSMENIPSPLLSKVIYIYIMTKEVLEK